MLDCSIEIESNFLNAVLYMHTHTQTHMLVHTQSHTHAHAHAHKHTWTCSWLSYKFEEYWKRRRCKCSPFLPLPLPLLSFYLLSLPSPSIFTGNDGMKARIFFHKKLCRCNIMCWSQIYPQLKREGGREGEGKREPRFLFQHSPPQSSWVSANIGPDGQRVRELSQIFH